MADYGAGTAVLRHPSVRKWLHLCLCSALGHCAGRGCRINSVTRRTRIRKLKPSREALWRAIRTPCLPKTLSSIHVCRSRIQVDSPNLFGALGADGRRTDMLAGSTAKAFLRHPKWTAHDGILTRMANSLSIDYHSSRDSSCVCHECPLPSDASEESRFAVGSRDIPVLDGWRICIQCRGVQTHSSNHLSIPGRLRRGVAHTQGKDLR